MGSWDWRLKKHTTGLTQGRHERFQILNYNRNDHWVFSRILWWEVVYSPEDVAKEDKAMKIGRDSDLLWG